MSRSPSRHRRLATRRKLRLVLAAGVLVAGLAALDAFWIEPRLLLVRDPVIVDLVPGRYRIVHLSDLHVESNVNLYERLLRRVAAEEPDLILVSGDLVADVRDTGELVEHAEAAARWVARLRPVAPVLAVQGHSDYLGEVVGRLAAGGLEWLSNEGRRIGPDRPGGDLLLLGLNQQVGHDAGEGPPPVFEIATVEGEPAVVARPPGRENAYLSYDPLRGDLASSAGPLSWSGYDAVVSVRVAHPETGAGLTVHCRHPLGEDRSIRLARAKAGPGDSGTFALTFNGSAPTAGELDTGVAPETGRWYCLRMRTEVAADRMRVLARVWPEGEEEPDAWQAWAEDRSPARVTAGTVALWTWGVGSVAYRDLRVVGRPVGGGAGVLLDRSLADTDGFREGSRRTRLEMALARSPTVPPGTPRIVLTHSPDSVVDAAREGVRLVLAGHTHGGQVRLPFVGALVTRTAIGRRYDRGLFRWPEAGARPGFRSGEPTLLYVNAGVGTSILPIRFFNPPTYAVFDF